MNKEYINLKIVKKIICNHLKKKILSLKHAKDAKANLDQFKGLDGKVYKFKVIDEEEIIKSTLIKNLGVDRQIRNSLIFGAAREKKD